MLCWRPRLVFFGLFLLFLLFFGQHAASLEQDRWAILILSSLCSGASWLFTAQVTPQLPGPAARVAVVCSSLGPAPCCSSETGFWAVTA